MNILLVSILLVHLVSGFTEREILGKFEQFREEIYGEIKELKKENGNLGEEVKELKFENGNLSEEVKELRYENGNLGEEVKELKFESSYLKDRLLLLEKYYQAGAVAFSVSASSSQTVAEGNKFAFDTILTNSGGGFVGSSDFICPVSGHYLFSLSILSLHSGYQVGGSISVDGVLGPKYYTASAWANAAGVHVVHCKEGQRVFAVCSGFGSCTSSTMESFSSFSGILIQADAN